MPEDDQDALRWGRGEGVVRREVDPYIGEPREQVRRGGPRPLPKEGAPDRPFLVYMIPFDYNFLGHGVTPLDYDLDEKRIHGAGPFVNGKANFKEFGYHPATAEIHVIDISVCRFYTGDEGVGYTKGPESYNNPLARSWAAFSEIEMLPEEKNVAEPGVWNAVWFSNWNMIRRCIRVVQLLNPNNITFTPNATIHDVMVVNALGIMPDIPRGVLQMRHAADPATIAAINRLNLLRPIPGRKCFEKPGSKEIL